ncbi:MAG TPA: 3-hydroxyacyl-ACP dehydratase FabZ [Burkholderiaceae bacterium]|nr:3-hydroxyacyl-ACP dehydratase FabZ [Burkholderiaceae bacterium]
MDIEKILGLMPHRYPILLVDRVLELEPGARIAAIKNVSFNEPFFLGHFPGHPVMPGVLIIEALAQAAAVLTYVTLKTSYAEGTLFYFAGIDGARFKRLVVPGDQLRLEVSMDRVKRGVGKFTGRALVDGDVACETEMMCALRNDKDAS